MKHEFMVQRTYFMSAFTVTYNQYACIHADYVVLGVFEKHTSFIFLALKFFIAFFFGSRFALR